MPAERTSLTRCNTANLRRDGIGARQADKVLISRPVPADTVQVLLAKHKNSHSVNQEKHAVTLEEAA